MLLLNVTEWTFQFAFMSGVNRLEPAKTTSAVPSFATTLAGVQLPVLVQWSFPWLPFHVHVAAKAGEAESSPAMPAATINPDAKLRPNESWINTDCALKTRTRRLMGCRRMFREYRNPHGFPALLDCRSPA